jgi:regulator of ribonuclease activity A
MELYTADICDNNKDIQVLEPIFRSFGGVSICHGKIVTIKLFEDNSDLVTLLRDKKGYGKICVVDVQGNYCAVVGETLMNYAYKNNWAGIVVNGYVRDIHKTSQIPVGLFALGTYPYKSQKKAKAKRDIELEFAGVCIKPNGILYADNDGIVVK